MIADRYELLSTLGQGAMGVVYRARERLSGQIVALKRLLVSDAELDFASRDASDDAESLRLSLALEFRTLATLRHPHIVSVLDYGFDEKRRPYYTMTFLDGARSLLEYAKGADQMLKLQLFVQILEALAYLHRRNILHRDLKPDNVLVTQDGQVKLIDFGLALSRSEPIADRFEGMVVGTLPYLAPDMILWQETNVRTDLYAVGVIAYELLLGRQPFPLGRSVSDMIGRIVDVPPDTSQLEGGLAHVLNRLLAKKPKDRPASAFEVIKELSEITGVTFSMGAQAIRESYLQASAFVGRAAEINQLRSALQTVAAGGSLFYLIGGESGVGKSRLMEELRTLALVSGVTVLQGRGISEGGLPFQLWRQPVRQLVLTASLDDLQASILKDIVPDIEELLGKSVPDAPELSGQAYQQRLVTALVDLIKGVNSPLLLILEDLHWAYESLLPIRQMLLIQDRLANLMVVGTYRDEERPDLAAELAGMEVLKLERFDRQAIAALSAAMLGEAGEQPRLLELLEQETEGNVFFMVEVVRALAEEVGHLNRIGEAGLPSNVFTGRMRELLQRRIERISGSDQDLLRLAAVAGREIDEALLRTAMPQADLEAWLYRCEAGAVLNVHTEHWQFAHDKLREAVLEMISNAERASLHRQVAEAIEQIYQGDLLHAAVLAQHWARAGDVEKEAHYAWLAGQQAYQISDYKNARRFLERLLILLPLPDSAFQINIQIMLGDILWYLAEFAAAIEYLEATLALARREQNIIGQANVLYFLSQISISQGDFPQMISYLGESLQLAEDVGDPTTRARVYFGMGDALWRLERYTEAIPYLEKCLELARSSGNHTQELLALNRLGAIFMFEENYAQAQHYFEACYQLALTVGNQERATIARSNLGELFREQGLFAESQAVFRETLPIIRQTGHHSFTVIGLVNMGLNELGLENAAGAYPYFHEALVLALEIHSTLSAISAIVGFAGIRFLEGDTQRAAEWIGMVINHPSADTTVKKFAGWVINHLQQSLPEAVFRQYQRRGQTLNEAAVIRDILGEKSV